MTTDAEKYSEIVKILLDDEIISWGKMPPAADIPASAIIRSLEMLKIRLMRIPHVTHTENSTRLD